ncbi:MAG: hypothetical protein JSV63_01150 [Candidatus Aenigmatarchaeota archaeon]|nr:MAG: hypothetical protein JSV63_01150 [Candidatus Aenigmarchaeota archaeon]
MRKAQLWTLDMALSLLIFFSALLSAIFAWNYISADTVENRMLKELQLKAFELSDSLIRTPGIPAVWNDSTVQVIGLAYSDNILDENKVKEFVGMDYSVAASMLDINPYEFYFEVKDINGTVYENSTVPLSASASTIVPIERYAVYNGRVVKVKLVIWE